MGGYATSAILGDFSKKLGYPAPVGKLRGLYTNQTVAGHKCSVLVSWHPAFEMRQSKMRNFRVNIDMYNDWKSVLEKVPEIGRQYVNHR